MKHARPPTGSRDQQDRIASAEGPRSDSDDPFYLPTPARLGAPLLEAHHDTADAFKILATLEVAGPNVMRPALEGLVQKIGGSKFETVDLRKAKQARFDLQFGVRRVACTSFRTLALAMAKAKMHVLNEVEEHGTTLPPARVNQLQQAISVAATLFLTTSN